MFDDKDDVEDTGRALIKPLPPIPKPTVSFLSDEALAAASDAPPHTVHDVIDEWFAKHFHGLGPHLTEFMHAKLYAAKEDLKDLIRPASIS